MQAMQRRKPQLQMHETQSVVSNALPGYSKGFLLHFCHLIEFGFLVTVAFDMLYGV